MKTEHEIFRMTLDDRFKSTTHILPKEEGKYWCIIPEDKHIRWLSYREGFWEYTQNFKYKTTIDRYRVSFWIEDELYEQYKKENL